MSKPTFQQQRMRPSRSASAAVLENLLNRIAHKVPGFHETERVRVFQEGALSQMTPDPSFHRTTSGGR